MSLFAHYLSHLGRKSGLALVAGAALSLVVMGSLALKPEWCVAAAPVCGHGSLPEQISTAESVKLGPNYATYSDAALQQAQAENKQLLLYFWAPWCSTCSALDDQLQETVERLPPQVQVLRVPYDDAKQLKQKYQITVQHTLVKLDESGEAIDKWVGGDADYLVKKVL
jgi:thiol-disulfide isomerase/thioredoxin